MVDRATIAVLLLPEHCCRNFGSDRVRRNNSLYYTSNLSRESKKIVVEERKFVFALKSLFLQEETNILRGTSYE